jgi:hypothetical protein
VPTDARSAEVQRVLIDSASQFARHAIDAYLEEHYEVFLVHAATASEHLLKASLCGRSVALIAQAAREGEHFRSLVALLAIDASGQSGAAKRASAASESIRTIGAEEALRRVAHFVPTFENGPVHDGLRALFTQRNGVVHLGEAGARNDAQRLRLSFVAACQQLLADIGSDASRFWRPHEELAARWGQDARSETERSVHDKVDAAKRRFQLVGDVVTPASMYDRLSFLREEFTDAIVDYCPACRLPCHATGYPDTAPADLDEDVALFVTDLWCDVCGLHLTRGELQLAGAPLFVPLPNVSTGELDDFYSTTTDSAERS